MKVLLDENIPHDLRPYLAHHETYTVAYLGWTGLKSGSLLDAAEANGFEVLVTGDLSMPYQQNLTGKRIAIVSLSAIAWPVIEPYLTTIVKTVDSVERGNLVRVECGAFRRRKQGAHKRDFPGHSVRLGSRYCPSYPTLNWLRK